MIDQLSLKLIKDFSRTSVVLMNERRWGKVIIRN